jgi:hypothetical protein
MVVDYGYGCGTWQIALVTKTVDNERKHKKRMSFSYLV